MIRLTRTFLNDRSFLGLLLFLVFLMYLPALTGGFAIDDLFHRAKFKNLPNREQLPVPRGGMFTFFTGDPEIARQWRDFGLVPWWVDEDIILNFWRPLTEFTHFLDYLFWPDSPVIMHLHSLLYYFFAIFLSWRLFSLIFEEQELACLATLVFAVSHVHSIPVAWLANRNSVFAYCLATLTLICHVRWRMKGENRFVLPAFLFFLAGLFAKEGAVAVLGYLAAFFLFYENKWDLEALKNYGPYLVILFFWRFLYKALGFGAMGSCAYIDPLTSPDAFVTALCERFPLLFVGQFGGPAPGIYSFLPPGGQGAFLLFAFFFTIVFLKLTVQECMGNRDAWMWLTGACLAIIPACTTFPDDRLLFFVSLGGAGFLARLFYNTLFQANEKSHSSVLFTLLFFFHVVISTAGVPVKIHVFNFLTGTVNRAALTLPSVDDMSQKTCVVLNSPIFFFTPYLALVRQLKGLPFPRKTLSLSGCNGFVPIRFSRLSDRVLRVAPKGGFPWVLLRDRAKPFKKGDRIKMRGFTVLVQKAAPQGHALVVDYVFDRSLEEPTFLWLRIKNGRYVPAKPPKIGESMTVSGF